MNYIRMEARNRRKYVVVRTSLANFERLNHRTNEGGTKREYLGQKPKGKETWQNELG